LQLEGPSPARFEESRLLWPLDDPAKKMVRGAGARRRGPGVFSPLPGQQLDVGFLPSSTARGDRYLESLRPGPDPGRPCVRTPGATVGRMTVRKAAAKAGCKRAGGRDVMTLAEEMTPGGPG